MLTRPEHDPDGAVRVGVVEKVFRRLAAVLVLRLGGQEIGTTAEHPFWVIGQGWTPAGQLRVGDRVGTEAGAGVVVEGVRETGELQAVYNLRVGECHTYFVGEPGWGWAAWSHNAYYQVDLAPLDKYRSALTTGVSDLKGAPLVASFNLNDTNWVKNDLQTYIDKRKQAGQEKELVYLLVARNPRSGAEEILKVGKSSGDKNGENGWKSRFQDYRPDALLGEYWRDGWTTAYEGPSKGNQISVMVFAVPKGQALTIEKQVRAKLYQLDGSAPRQNLPMDYSRDGRWSDFNTPPPGGGDKPLRRNPVSSLDFATLFAGTAFQNIRPSMQLDLNYEGDTAPKVREADTGKRFIYLIEAPTAPSDRSILKAGYTTSLSIRINNSNSGEYRAWATKRFAATMHLFEVTDHMLDQLTDTQLRDSVRAKLSSGNQKQIKEGLESLEHALRMAVYGHHKQWLLEDHTAINPDTGAPWRTTDDKLRDFGSQTNTDPATFKKGPVIPGLGT